MGESVPGYKIRDMVREVDLDENGTVEFNEFLTVSSFTIQVLCSPIMHVILTFMMCTVLALHEGIDIDPNQIGQAIS